MGNALRYRRSTQEASSDAVTGLLNHREMLRRLDAELAWRRDSGREMSFILIDIDHFKDVNDSMGHQHGDQVLRTAAKLVHDTVRAHDLVARYGGDELAVIVLDSTPDGADALAQRLVDAIHAARITTSPGNQLTLSMGVASFPGDALTGEELLMAADQALYMSKRSGRDRSTTCGALVARVAADEQALMAMLRDAGPQVALPVGHALDLRLGTAGRSSAVAALVGLLAERAGVGADPDVLRSVAFVHDIGGLKSAPGAAATDGGALLEEAGFPVEVVTAVRHRDERWDGQGVPDHLAGAAIPPEARTIAVAAAFETAISGRGGAVLSPAQAVEALEADAGAYDPAVLAALRSVVEEQALPPLPAPVEGRPRTATTATIPPAPAAIH
jgi:diguanylate cyclase (GGDEF)-like protein